LEFPVCSFDLKSGIFCPKCEAKIRSGEVTELDVQVMKLLQELERSISQLGGLSYRKSVQSGEVVFVVLGEGSLARLTPPQQAMVRKKISEKLKANVRLVEDSRDINKFIQSLVAPARITMVNRIWLPDQSEEMRVVLNDERSLRIRREVVEDVVGRVKGVTVRIDFERRGRRRGF